MIILWTPGLLSACAQKSVIHQDSVRNKFMPHWPTTAGIGPVIITPKMQQRIDQAHT